MLTKDNYFEDNSHMSVSRYKAMLKCEGNINFEKPSQAMLVGSYVDAFVEGELDSFVGQHPEIYATTGKNKGLLKNDFKKAEEICRFIEDDKICKQFLSGKKQIVMTGEISSVPFKIKMDSYSPDIAIVDLKVMATLRKRGNLYNFITSYGYDIQLACYQEIVKQNTGKVLPCYILAITKETPIERRVIQIPQYVLDEKLNEVRQDIVRLYKVFKGEAEPNYCGNCPQCIKNKKYKALISLDEIEKENNYE